MTPALSAHALRTALGAALTALRERRAGIDAMNVYPVPDADTGTNLVLTFDAIARAAGEAGERDVDIAHAIRSGSLMGARGNSGVICSQIVQAWAESVEAGPADGDAVARAFKRAVESAYEAVLHPAEGTILSVLRAASDAAQVDGADAGARFGAAARAAAVAVDRTPEQMELLARAGVVDAGGAGLAIVLAAMARALGSPVEAPRFEVRERDHALAACGDPPSFAYEVMYMLEADDARVPALRALLGTIGDSVAVTGGRGAWRVHVHTDSTDRALSMGRAVGAVSGISVVEFAQQMAEGARGILLAVTERPSTLVIVARGAGNRRLLEELGAVVVERAADVHAAVETASRDHVIVLPDGPASRSAALEAAHALRKTVIVLPVTDVAAALSVAAQYSDGRPAEDSVADMNDALARIRSAVANDAAGAVAAVRAMLGARPAELVTLVCGAGVTAPERDAVVASLADAAPGSTVEVYDGGQPEPFVVAVE